MPESPRNLSRKRAPDPRIGTPAHKARQRLAMRNLRSRLDGIEFYRLTDFGGPVDVAEIFSAAQVLPAKAVCTSHVGRDEMYENR